MKKWTGKRVLRDLAILLLLCGTFYVSAVVVGQIGNEESANEATFSKERLQADRLEVRHNWTSAAVNFRHLVEKDPFNGYAWKKLATCYLRLRFDVQESLNNFVEPETRSFEKLDLQNQFQEFDDLALGALQECKQFLRYRRFSLYYLAALHAGRDENEVAINYLDEFVSEGNFIAYGLDSVESFGTGGPGMQRKGARVTPATRLHRFPKFWELVERESNLRFENAAFRPRWAEQ